MPGMEDINTLLQNKMFLQMLSSAGTDLMQGTGGTNLNAAVQGNIQAQNMMKLLKTLLGPDGTKGTIDSTGIKLSIPKESSMFSSILGGEGAFKANESLAPGAPSKDYNNLTSVLQGANAGGMYGSGGGLNIANPFVEGQTDLNIDPSDLAGLTTQDISAALGMKMKQAEMKQQSYRDMLDSIYKGEQIVRGREAAAADIPYKKALTKAAEASAEADTPSISVEGVPFKMTPKDYLAYQKLLKEDKSAAVKNYEYAKEQGFKGSFVEFEDRAKTTHKKDYDEAVAGGYKGSFHNWMLEMAKAGAINLGEKLTEKKEMGELGGQLYFDNPKWTTDLSGHLDSKSIRTQVSMSDDPNLTRSVETVKFVEGKIAAGGGSIQSVVMDKDGKTMVWTVRWPSGDVKTIRQAVR